MSGTVLAVEGLSAGFAAPGGIVPVVRSVDFAVERGEKLAIVGEPGCGKSTLALALLGLLHPPGWVSSLRRHAERARRLQPVRSRHEDGSRAGNFARLPEHDGRIRPAEDDRRADHRHVAPSPAGPFPPSRARADGCPASRGRDPGGGAALFRLRAPIFRRHAPAVDDRRRDRQRPVRNRRRRADEPTTALDATTQAQILALLDRLVAQHSIALVLITHDFGVVAKLCGVVQVKYMGEFVERGEVRSVFERPAHPYTRALLRSIPGPGARAQGRLPAIDGAPPDPRRLPLGCSFEPRCPRGRGNQLCALTPPPRVDLPERGRGAFAQCHFAQEILLEGPAGD